MYEGVVIWRSGERERERERDTENEEIFVRNFLS